MALTGEDILTVIIIVLLCLFFFGCSCSYYYGSVSTFTNVMKCSGSNLMTSYTTISHGEKIEDVMKSLEDKPAMFAVLADFCIHCRNLKKSGELDKLAKKHKVFVMDEQHPQAGELMTMVQSKGFPTLAIYRRGSLSLYVGGRKAEDMEMEM